MIKEARQFFVRHGAVTTGVYRDRELTFSKTYSQGVLAGKYNMFLKDDYPSQETYQKLIESIPFFINPESTAFEQQQGLVQKTTDTKALNRDSSDNGLFEADGTTTGNSGISQDIDNPLNTQHKLNSTNYTTAVLPHQVPNVVNAVNEDGADTVLSETTKNGIKLSRLSTVLTGLAGKFRKNFKVAVDVFRSVAIDPSTQKVQLVNDLDDATLSGKYGYYGVNNGVRGWQYGVATPISDGVHTITVNTITISITTQNGLITAIN